MSLPRLSIARPVGVAMFYIALVSLGIMSFTRLPIDLLPDIAYPRLVVYTTYPDAAPSEVERFVTELVEQSVSSVPGVENVESISRAGVSLVVLRFAWGTDMDFAALNVREKVDQIRDALPTRITDRPVVLRTDPRSEPIAAISVSGLTDLAALKDLTESVFRRRLEQLDGIAQASVSGGLDPEIHVDVDLRRLESHGLTISDLETALAGANQSSPSGSILRGRFRYPLRTLGELQEVEQIEKVVVARPAVGGPTGSGAQGMILLRDVARVENGFREPEAIARYNGSDAIGILLFKESGANTVRVMEDVEEVLAQLRSDYPEISIDIAQSQAKFVSGAISNLVQEMILGAILAFLVLVMFLRDARFPVGVGLAIPISVILTFAFLHAAGVSLNIMSLGGLALGVGMLVDNSIVVIENIFRHREKGIGAAIAAAIGTEEVQRAVLASTLTTIAVFGPIIYVEGVAGQLFASLSFAVAFSLMASLLVACTLLPALAAGWKGDVATRRATEGWRGRLNAPLHAFDRAFERFALWYERILEWSLHNRRRVLLLSGAALLITLPAALALPRSVLPEVDQGSFRVRLELPQGTPLDVTSETASRIEAMLRADPGVEAVFTHVGRRAAMLSSDTDESGLNTATMEVRLKGGRGTEAALERLRPQLRDFPPGMIAIETGHATALGKLLGGSDADLAVRVHGDDLDAALAYARQVEQRLASVEDISNVRIGMEVGQPEVLVEVDRDRAAAFGIEARAVTQMVENYMGGVPATEFVDFDRKIPVIIRLPEEARRSIDTLERLHLQGVPLRELVTVRETLSPTEIRRIDQVRTVPVYADVANGDVDEAVASIRAALEPVPPPDGLGYEIGGENEEMRKSFRDLALAFALAVMLVYMILAAEFESFAHPFTVLLTVPLSLIGAVWALFALGGGVNTVSLIGVIVLVGIVDNDAVVKLDFINQMRREGMSVRDAIMAAGHARLRPIVMNTLTAMLAILPMMFGIGPGAALQAPMAITVFGGLFSATALTLVVIPVAYELVDEAGARARGWFAARKREPVVEAEQPVQGEPVAAGD